MVLWFFVLLIILSSPRSLRDGCKWSKDLEVIHHLIGLFIIVWQQLQCYNSNLCVDHSSWKDSYNACVFSQFVLSQPTFLLKWKKKINNAVNFAAVRISMSISVFSIKQVHSNSKLTCKSHFRKCLRLQRKKHLYAITNCNTKPWNATLFILKYVWAHGCIFVYLYMLRYLFDYNISHYSTFTICIGSISICPPKVALIVYKFNGNKS